MTCILCNNAIETQDHLFLHCDLARVVWFGADINIRPITDTGTPVEQWLQALILMPSAANCNITHLHMTLTLLWCIWFHRNQVNFDGKQPNPMDIILTTKSLMNRFLQSPTNSAGTIEMESSTTRPTWQLHDNWQILITTEGSAARNSRWQGIAFMGKTRDGHITLVGCKSTTAQDAKMTKAIAIRKAINKAIHLGYRKMIILVGDKEIERVWSKINIAR